MKSFIGIFTAFSWFFLCVTAAFFLLVAALIYSGWTVLRKTSVVKKIEFPRIQIAR